MDFMDILDSSSTKIIGKNHSSNSLLIGRYNYKNTLVSTNSDLHKAYCLMCHLWSCRVLQSTSKSSKHIGYASFPQLGRTCFLSLLHGPLGSNITMDKVVHLALIVTQLLHAIFGVSSVDGLDLCKTPFTIVRSSSGINLTLK